MNYLTWLLGVTQVPVWRDRLGYLFELSRGGKADNLRAMEGIRGLAVLLVFFVHYVSLSEPWTARNTITSAIAHALHETGLTGVDLFFVLSGYLIYGHLIARPQPFAKYAMRRIVRIYPAFTAVFTTYIVLSLIFPQESRIPVGTREGFVYLLQNFLLLPGLFPLDRMISVAWTLSYEMFYYVVIPLLISTLRLRSWRPWARVCFFSTIALSLFAYCAWRAGPAELNMFIAGILLFETLNAKLRRAPPEILGGIGLFTGVAAMLIPVESLPGYVGKLSLVFAGFYFFCMTCFSNRGGALATIFEWAPMRWLGNMSYSYYLLHGLTLKGVFLALSTFVSAGARGEALFWLLMPGAFVATLLTSACLFLLVERPLSLTSNVAKP